MVVTGTVKIRVLNLVDESLNRNQLFKWAQHVSPKYLVIMKGNTVPYSSESWQFPS